MSHVSRFSVSLPQDLLEKFDALIASQHYPTRSKAIGDLIRESLVENEWTTEKEVAGAIVLVYDHHTRELSNTLVEVQHHFHKIIVSTQHIHLDHDNCLEILAVRGKAPKVQELSHKLRAIKGILHTSLAMTTSGSEL
ncbi:MAG TPA: nickel-responsive transcriptional regulator NikR [Synergistaceae bacterium]|nr:nickel-responsive transcriptional regulator NikR [Synergistaceae bacterium]HPJ25513.1 nickel-responsive transcriptional regulator NikR [Synergistaceae bacterium]HPQ36034.1 nickel-responsive transcriptional regulator NikR [Synergistaceae bacterium]